MGAQISPPGSRHKSGGWRLLSTPLSEARAAAEHPNGPGVWSALLTEFAAELQVSAARSAAAPNQARAGCLNAELDDTGAPWIPRLGGRAPLGAGLDQAARTGRWDRSRYPDRSAARMAVLAAAAAARHLMLTPRVRAVHLVLGAIIPIAVSMVVVTLGIWWWATQSSVTLLVLAVTNLALASVLAPGKIGRAVRRGRRLQAAASGATVINPSAQRTHGRHRT